MILYLRRPHLPQVNKSKWTAFPGFLKGYAGLDDAMRWRFYTYIFSEQIPSPYESVLRCDAHPNFSIRFGEAWTDVTPRFDGVTIHTPAGAQEFAAAILGTGFDVDLALRPEIAPFRDDILLWRDRVSSDEAALHPECARFPYVGPGFELMARDPGGQPGLSSIHILNWGLTLSHGALAGDIPGLAIGVNRLSEALCRDLLCNDIECHWARLQALDDEELEPTRRYVPRDQRRSSRP